MTLPEKNNTCFIIVGGFASDTLPVMPLKQFVSLSGYPTIAVNFWGEEHLLDFSKLTLQKCLAGLTEVIEKSKQRYTYVVGLGISLGGALLMEYAKQHQGLDYIISIGTPFRLKNRRWIAIGMAIQDPLYLIWRHIEQFLRLAPLGAGKMTVNFFEHEFLEHLDAIHTPVLMLHSKTDRVTDYRATIEWSQKLTHARHEVKIFENGSHVIDHDPSLILQCFDEFTSSAG